MNKTVLTSFTILCLLSTVFLIALAFNVQPAKGWTGTVYIRADGSIDPPDAPIVTFDNVTYTLTDDITTSVHAIVVERDNIVIDGTVHIVQNTMKTGIGIDLSDRSNVSIKNINIKDFWAGILLGRSHYNSIVGNVFVNNGIVVEMGPGDDSYGNVVVDNLVNDKPLVYLEGVSDMVVEDAGQVILVNCNRIRVENLNLYDATTAVMLWGTNNTKIVGNSITNNDGWCIALWESSNNNISGNSMTNNEYGIYLGSSNYNNITENDITNNMGGISFYVSSNNSVIGNNIKNNRDYGIYHFESSGNRFFHNNFIGNTQQVRVQSDYYSYANIWDNGYPSGGNYWSDYSDADVYSGLYQNETGSDGIGDTPYILDTDNRDRYPLISAWGVAVSPPPEVQVGVETGDWIKVEYTITGWPAGTPYPLWLKVEFLSVEGTSANVRVTMHMSDGTEQTETVPVDVVAGGGEAFGLSGFIVPANLTTGDSVYITGYGNVTIAGETTGTYAGASRTVVYASISQYGTQLTYYWDKQTGVMVAASTTFDGVTATAKATETNMWEAAPPTPFWMQWWLWTIVAVGIIALAGAVYFLKKRN